MSDIPCPSCGGRKQLQIVHVSQLQSLCAGDDYIETDDCGMSSESQPKTEQERDAMASEIRKAIEPVADWFECEEGYPIPLIEVVAEIAKMLAEERQDTLRYRKALQDIIKHQERVAGLSMVMRYPIVLAKKALQDDLADTIAKAWRSKPLDSPSLVKGDGSQDSDSKLLRAMTLQFKPELTHSVWVDTFLSDENDCQLPKDQLVERLKQGVRDGEWVAWRLIHIEQEVMGNVD